MSVERDRALILRRFAYGETSLVLHVLAPGHGRVHVMAKGAYRTTSRYFAALDLFDTLELEWSHQPSRELQILREATIVRRRAALGRDLPRYRAALAVLELAALAAREGQPAAGLFAITEGALEGLHGGAAPPALELAIFELAFLRDLGLAPALVHCAACSRPATPAATPDARTAFAAGAGGRLCRRCADEARRFGRRVVTLPARTLELAASLLEHSAPGAPRPGIPAPELEKVREFVVRFLEYHLESRPKSYRRPLVPTTVAARPRSRPSAAP